MRSQRLFIGIDGGSTKSAGVLLSEDREVLGRATAGPANYHIVGSEETARVLGELLGALRSRAGAPASCIHGHCFALAGVSRPVDHERLGAVLAQLGVEGTTVLTCDAQAHLVGGTGRGEGIAIVAGTGSIVFGRNRNGQSRRLGGHGHLINDTGGGYDIGLKALQAVLRSDDRLAAPTRLTEALLAALRMTSADEIVPWLYGLSNLKPEVARLASTALRTAEEGDLVAQEILSRASDELAAQVAVAARDLELGSGAVEVVLGGGVIENSSHYFAVLREAILKRLPLACVVAPHHDAAYGAALIAIERTAASGYRSSSA